MTRASAGACVSKAYNLALILTGQSEIAESIVLAAIESVPNQKLSNATLLAEVAKACWIDSQTAAPAPNYNLFGGLSRFPDEIRSVSELPGKFRYSFSLRVLAGMTAQGCASILGLRPDQVDYLAQQAMCMLGEAASSALEMEMAVR